MHYLEQETETCPRECGMARIVLNGGIAHGCKFLHPVQDLPEKLAHNHFLAICFDSPLLALAPFHLGINHTNDTLPVNHGRSPFLG
jgi:hypothetical protein